MCENINGVQDRVCSLPDPITLKKVLYLRKLNSHSTAALENFFLTPDFCYSWSSFIFLWLWASSNTQTFGSLQFTPDSHSLKTCYIFLDKFDQKNSPAPRQHHWKYKIHLFHENAFIIFLSFSIVSEGTATSIDPEVWWHGEDFRWSMASHWTGGTIREQVGWDVLSRDSGWHLQYLGRLGLPSWKG